MESGYFPKAEDVYNPNEPNYGNSNYGKEGELTTLIWDFNNVAKLDFRLFYVFKDKANWSKCRWDPASGDTPEFYNVSDVTGH